MNTRIKFLRKNSGLTQEKFAERIGLKQNSIALIESGKRNISDQAILSICREFGRNGCGLGMARCTPLRRPMGLTFLPKKKS